MSDRENLYDIHDLAVRCGVDVGYVEQLLELGVIAVHPGSGRVFACEVTLRVGKLVRLQRDLGVNLEGAALVVELLDRIEQLEARLRHFEGR